MTDLSEKAVLAVRGMPAEDQEAIAHAMLSLAGLPEPEEIEPEHLDAVMVGLAQADRSGFVDGEANAVVARAFAHART